MPPPATFPGRGHQPGVGRFKERASSRARARVYRPSPARWVERGASSNCPRLRWRRLASDAVRGIITARSRSRRWSSPTAFGLMAPTAVRRRSHAGAARRQGPDRTVHREHRGTRTRTRGPARLPTPLLARGPPSRRPTPRRRAWRVQARQEHPHQRPARRRRPAGGHAAAHVGDDGDPIRVHARGDDRARERAAPRCPIEGADRIRDAAREPQ